MRLEDRLWALNKVEAAAVRDYYTKLQNVRDELNTIVCEDRKQLQNGSLLTLSLLRGLYDFYKKRYQLTKILKAGTIGTSTGEYLEEIIHSSLSAFLAFKLKEEVSIRKAREKWLHIMTDRWFGYGVHEYDTKVLMPIGKLYEEIFEKCKSYKL